MVKKKIVFLLLFGMTAELFCADYSIRVDAKTSWGPLPNFWSNCVSVGRLGLVRSDTLQRHLMDASANLGAKMVRFHAGLTDANIYREENGVPVYDWATCDSLYDIIVKKLRLKPVIELTWMPTDLASQVCESRGVFDPSSGNYCYPKDYDRWKELIREFVNHLTERYGATEVETWRFETWNEGEWFGFYGNGGPSLEESFKLQAYSIMGAREALPTIRIGGPAASSYDFQMSNSGPFLDYCGERGLQVDFLSYHAYHEAWKTVEGHFSAIKTIKTYNAKYSALKLTESCNTEYGPTWEFLLDPQPHETDQAALYVAEHMSRIARRCRIENVPFPSMYAWWVLSDVFDEGRTYRTDYPFTGCMGMLSLQDIRKPVYNTFRMMSMLGSTFTAMTVSPDDSVVNGLAAQDSTGIQVFLYNTGAGASDISLSIDNIEAPGNQAGYRCYLMDRDHGNSYRTWVTMGKPAIAEMSASQWDRLRKSMDMVTVESMDSFPLTNGSFKKNYSLDGSGIMLVTLSFGGETTVSGDIRHISPARPLETPLIYNIQGRVVRAGEMEPLFKSKAAPGIYFMSNKPDRKVVLMPIP